MKVRRANQNEAIAVHGVLCSAKREIPLVDNFDGQQYRDWVKQQCVNKVVWVTEGVNEPSGVMIMKGHEVAYLAVSGQYRRQGCARALIKLAKSLKPKGLQIKINSLNEEMKALLSAENFLFVKDSDGAYCKWHHYTWKR
jgi:hypothetical protein